MINMANLGEAIASGCMEPLENLFYDEWTEEQKADIDNELFRAGYDGTYHYEIPLFSGTFGVMYRKDLFEQFSIKVEDIKTWDDLVEAAQTLTYVNDEGLQVWGLRGRLRHGCHRPSRRTAHRAVQPKRRHLP